MPSRQLGTTQSSADGSLLITVVRSGGFAGIRREWQVEPPADELSAWVVLIDACPWGSVGADPASRDRFVWSIEARVAPGSGATAGATSHADARRARAKKATVPEQELTGPWKELVDRVRHAESALPVAPPASDPADDRG